MHRLALPLFAVALLSGCVIPYHYNQDVPDLAERAASTGTKIPPDQISHNRPHPNISGVKFALLFANSNNDPTGYGRLIKSALISVGFPEVLDEVEFTKRLVNSGAPAPIGGTQDLAALHQASKAIGSFVVVEARLTQLGTHNWRSALSVIDPSGPETLLQYDIGRVALLSIEKELNYPMFNVLREWYQSSSTVSANNHMQRAGSP